MHTNDSATRERERLLEAIWQAQANQILAILETTPTDQIKAATLNVARQFLTDNGVSKDTLADKAKAAEHVAALIASVQDEAVAEDREAEPEANQESSQKHDFPVPSWPDMR